MRPRRIKNQDSIINESKYILDPNNIQGKIFDNNNPIHLEIGVGKGDFIIGMAKKYPNINFIGVEVQDSVIVRAVKKLNKEDLPNVRLLNMDANKLNEIIDHEIDVLYLNFSDPWPKKRHHKRRLTSDSFLKEYERILKDDGKIIFKTDNEELFNFSIETFENNGFKIISKTNNYLGDDDFDACTEYEARFREKNMPIHRMVVTK